MMSPLGHIVTMSPSGVNPAFKLDARPSFQWVLVGRATTDNRVILRTMSERASDDLVGTNEAAGVFGVRPQNFLRDWVSRPDLPAPLANLAATRVWGRRDLEAYRDLQRGGVR